MLINAGVIIANKVSFILFSYQTGTGPPPPTLPGNGNGNVEDVIVNIVIYPLLFTACYLIYKNKSNL